MYDYWNDQGAQCKIYFDPRAIFVSNTHMERFGHVQPNPEPPSTLKVHICQVFQNPFSHLVADRKNSFQSKESQISLPI